MRTYLRRVSTCVTVFQFYQLRRYLIFSFHAIIVTELILLSYTTDQYNIITVININQCWILTGRFVGDLFQMNCASYYWKKSQATTSGRF
jgi:hypothetical protein